MHVHTHTHTHTHTRQHRTSTYLAHVLVNVSVAATKMEAKQVPGHSLSLLAQPLQGSSSPEVTLGK